MAEQTFDLEFDGYWRETNVSNIPSESGIYCVYECTINKENKLKEINRLIYIGQAGDVNERLKNHEKRDEWKKEISKDKVIYFSYAKVKKDILDRVEAALIFEHKPPVNTDCINEFNYDKTTINTKGKNSMLHENFTVSKKSSLWD